MDSESAAPRPRLRSPESTKKTAHPAEIALALMRFHTAPPVASPEAGEYRSAAINAVEVPASEVVEGLLDAEGELPPEDAQDLAEGSIVHLWRLAVRRRLEPRRDDFLAEIRELARRLRDRLEAEQAIEEAREPEHLEQALTPGAAGHIDFTALSDVIGEDRGPVRLRPEERKRARTALVTLESFSFAGDGPLVRIVHGADRAPEAIPGVVVEAAEDPAQAAVSVFDRESAQLVDVARALRVADLVLDNTLDESRHGPWLDQFGPRDLRSDELALLSPVVAMQSLEVMEEQGLRSFSRLLRSGRPVHLMVIGSSRRVPGLSVDSEVRDRLEPAYLAMGYRRAFAQQSSPADVPQFLAGLLASLDHARPALHMLDETEGPADRQAAARSLASRAHPCFRYDPAGGSSWARRLDFAGNPAPESVWPVETLEAERSDGSVKTLELPVTFADLLLETPEAQAHLSPVPPGCPEDALSPLADWLELDRDQARLHVPWLWAIDAQGLLVRVAVTRRLASVARERADFWHTLQELAGVRNEYVTEAVHRVRTEDEAAAAAERDRMQAEHADQLAASKRQAVEQAMSNLARRLLDAGAIPAPGSGGTAPDGAAPEGGVPAPAAAPATAAPAAAPAAADGQELGAAWIDTPLCTSCNDCTAINPHVFVYDENKQALIGDLHAGTFAQVVKAAEKCPARCIHPGSPWNPDEPGLDKLIARAKAYQ